MSKHNENSMNRINRRRNNIECINLMHTLNKNKTRTR